MDSEIVMEETVRKFNFYHAGRIQKGVVWNNKLYRHVATFYNRDYCLADALSSQLQIRGISTLITIVGSTYNVWSDLRNFSD